ncbi:SSI family serine proteinase inhibitor [Kineosporia sp. R_H_3]|uniref:SSI family serine proteinase inhibitor n=1 Tax=Kineosporia sp. R_H_3 TaxID=1961848 RepID=UPI0013044D0B|nr:SSI family serine proteinase inhibitor [Kineosporia sp. R_H_3]
MVTLRTARGAVVPAAVVLLTTTLAACSGSSAVTTSAAPSSSATSAPAVTTTSATSSAPVSKTRTATRTASPDPASTRTVYAGPERTSTLVPWDEPTAKVTGSGRTPSAAAGSADLKILLDDGFGIRATWTLTCDPAGGSHPAPAVACGVLGANGAKALKASTSATCAEQYGGPQKALVTGTWRGAPVKSQFTLENACEVGRWTAMIGLLPPGGV